MVRARGCGWRRCDGTAQRCDLVCARWVRPHRQGHQRAARGGGKLFEGLSAPCRGGRIRPLVQAARGCGAGARAGRGAAARRTAAPCQPDAPDKHRPRVCCVLSQPEFRRRGVAPCALWHGGLCADGDHAHHFDPSGDGGVVEPARLAGGGMGCGDLHLAVGAGQRALSAGSDRHPSEAPVGCQAPAPSDVAGDSLGHSL